MFTESGCSYQVVRGTPKIGDKKYYPGDIIPVAGIPERNFNAMISLGWIKPAITPDGDVVIDEMDNQGNEYIPISARMRRKPRGA